MTHAEFWSLIERSRSRFDPERRDGNMEQQLEVVEGLLEELSTDDVCDFKALFTSYFHQAYRWDLWDAVYVIRAGCSDDSFDYFRFWLISMGRAVYEKALADPESLSESESQPDVEDIFFEEFSYVPDIVLEKRGDDSKCPEAQGWQSQPVGQRCTEQELPTRFPKLWKLYGEQ